MVRAMKSIAEPSLPSSVNRLTRLMHNASHGVLFLFTGQILHDYVMDQMLFLIPFQYIADFIVTSRWVCPRS
jgi:hypothetical protein